MAPTRKLNAGAAAKRNMAPPAGRILVSTSALFKSGPTLERIRKRHPKMTTGYRPSTRVPMNIVAPSKKVNDAKDFDFQKSLPHPLAAEFTSTANDYRSTISNSVQDSLEPIHEDLVRHLNRAKLQEDGVEVDGLAAQLARAAKISSAMSSPLGNDVLRIRYRDSDSVQDIAVGETVASFAEKLKEKENQIDKLWREWDLVCQEIAELGAEMLDEPSLAAPFGRTPVNGHPLASAENTVITPHIDRLHSAILENTRRALADVDHEAQADAEERRKTRQRWLSFLRLDDERSNP
ncbi:hypothetical protein MBLNU459_g5634t1 [Dothideomycetes sp. NU459]